MKINVVIPYFQREPGILRRAVESVARQEVKNSCIEAVEVVVVDDGSPCPGGPELSEVEWPDTMFLTYLRQPNAGPGSARNRAIDASGDVDAIAFLDSDDEWMPDHLARAGTAFEAGADVYASNWIPLGDRNDAFQADVRRDLQLTPVPTLAEAGTLVLDPLVSALTTPAFKLSGLVFNRSKFPGLRFRSDLRTASEDRLFIYEMMSKQPLVIVSRRVEVKAGGGVNIYESKAWGTKDYMQVISNQIIATKAAMQILSDRDDAMPLLNREMHVHRNSFAALCWHLMRRNKLPVKDFVFQLRADPMLLKYILIFPIKRISVKQKKTEAHYGAS